MVLFFIAKKGMKRVKKWVDPSEIMGEYEELDEELKRYQSLMEEKPNFDKSDNGHKIYQRKQYSIYKVKNGHIIHNTNLPFEEGHTHITGFNMAKTIIDNCLRKKQPTTTNLYLLKSHARVTDDPKYRKLIEELIEAKKSKGKKNYRNRSF